MGEQNPQSDKGPRWMRIIAVILALIWGGFWTFFGVASGVSEALGPMGILLHSIFPGLIFLISAIVAWRWGRIGGIVLLIEAIFILVAYPIKFGRLPLLTMLLTMIFLGFPPLVAGILFLLHARKLKSERRG